MSRKRKREAEDKVGEAGMALGREKSAEVDGAEGIEKCVLCCVKGLVCSVNSVFDRSE